jgi:phosphoglycerate kinase
MQSTAISKRLPLLQEADLDGKVVLVRFDHNVVQKGVIKDPFRIDKTLGSLYYILDRGGRPILMTHVGRPRDKKTGNITCSPKDSVEPIVEYLKRKLYIEFLIPECEIYPETGISGIELMMPLVPGSLMSQLMILQSSFLHTPAISCNRRYRI